MDIPSPRPPLPTDGSIARAASAAADSLRPLLIDDRRYFHAHPELGWEERETTARSAERLAALGYRVTLGEALLRGATRMGVPDGADVPTGCVAEIDSGRPGPTVALRVDLDALPIQEAERGHRPSAEGWASSRPGLMHACGHDGHIAIGLAVARLMAVIMPTASGKMRLLFQPAEEGTRGARSFVDAGWLADVDMLLAFHIGLGVPSGTVALGTSGFLATRKYRAILAGRSAHAGQSPESGRSALLCACQTALALHNLAQTSAPGVRVNVGTLRAGRALNVVPDRAELGFELRAAGQSTLDELSRRALHLVNAMAHAHENTATVTMTGEATSWRNDPGLAEWAKQIAASGKIFSHHRMEHDFAASEDATLMLRAVRQRGGHAAYFVLGANLAGAHHTPQFDFDERVLIDGTALMVALLQTFVLYGVDRY